MPNDYEGFSLEQLGPFLASHPGRGTMRIQVTSGHGTFPVPDAIVEVSAELNGTLLPLYRKKTNSSGIVDDLILPAKPRLASQREPTAADSATLYSVTVTHPGYRGLTDRHVVIYDGVETIWPAALEPVFP